MNTRSLKYILLMFLCVPIAISFEALASESDDGVVPVEASPDSSANDMGAEIKKGDSETQKTEKIVVEEPAGVQTNDDNDENPSNDGSAEQDAIEQESVSGNSSNLEGKVFYLTTKTIENDTKQIVLDASNISKNADKLMSFVNDNLRMQKGMVNGKEKVFFDTNVQEDSSEQSSIYGSSTDLALREALPLAPIK